MRIEQWEKPLRCVCTCVWWTDQFLPLVLFSWWLFIVTQLGLLKMAHQHAAANNHIQLSINNLRSRRQFKNKQQARAHTQTHTHAYKKSLNPLVL